MDCEQELLAAVRDKSEGFASAVDAFLSAVLADVGHAGRFTHGVLFTLQEWRGDGAFGLGVAVRIATQRVEPVRIDLRLDASRTRFASGLLQFGDLDAPEGGHGSAGHRRLTRRMLGNRDPALSWRHQFWFHAGAWHASPTQSP